MVKRHLVGLALTAALGLATPAGADDGPSLTRDGPEVQPQGELKPGDTIPPFTLPLLGGGQLTWPDDLQGKTLVVNFWATWCDPCVEEVPSLERLRRQLKGTDVAVVTVNIDDPGDMGAVRDLLDKSHAQFVTALDPGGKFALSWGTAKLPETYIVDASGVVREKIIGAQLWDRGDRIRAYKALAQGDSGR